MYEDPSLARVAEFHDAFGAMHRTEPGMHVLNENERDVIGELATELAMIAQRLKAMAAAANQDGRPELGLTLVRLQLDIEETGELAAGIADQDIVSVFDALLDKGYVNNGHYLTFGLGGLKALGEREVHRSNMSKLGNGGKPLIHPSGRVLKGPRYSPPDLRSILDFATGEANSC